MGKRKSVIAVNITTGEETAYPSIRMAATSVGASYGCVARVLKGENKSSKGYTFIYEGDEVPDLNTITGKRGRPKSGETQQNTVSETKIKRYYFTKERGVYTEKVARWNTKNHVLTINYNFKVSLIDEDVCPNLDFMQDIVRGKMNVRRRKFIYVLDGCVSKKEKGIYFINAQMYIICDEFPSVEQLKQYERWITDVRYYDDEGKNDFNDRRLLRKRKNDDSKMHAVILTNLETEEEIRYNSVKEAAEEFEVSSFTIGHWCQQKKKKNGFQWRYAY